VTTLLDSRAKDRVTVNSISRGAVEISLKINTADLGTRPTVAFEESAGPYGRRMWSMRVRVREREMVQTIKV
jgi:hypothetical protein